MKSVRDKALYRSTMFDQADTSSSTKLMVSEAIELLKIIVG